jgi:hypothetical protein
MCQYSVFRFTVGEQGRSAKCAVEVNNLAIMKRPPGEAASDPNLRLLGRHGGNLPRKTQQLRRARLRRVLSAALTAHESPKFDLIEIVVLLLPMSWRQARGNEEA